MALQLLPRDFQLPLRHSARGPLPHAARRKRAVLLARVKSRVHRWLPLTMQLRSKRRA
jgi:hypothetical protein